MLKPAGLDYSHAEYLINLQDDVIPSFVTDHRIKAAGVKTNCNIELTKRILNRKVNGFKWVKYSILRVTGPDEGCIRQCNKIIERVYPPYKYRKEYLRRAPVVLFTGDVLPDNTSLYFPKQRTGRAGPVCGEMRVESPYEIGRSRNPDAVPWKGTKCEEAGIHYPSAYGNENVLKFYNLGKLTTKPINYNKDGVFEPKLVGPYVKRGITPVTNQEYQAVGISRHLKNMSFGKIGQKTVNESDKQDESKTGNRSENMSASKSGSGIGGGEYSRKPIELAKKSDFVTAQQGHLDNDFSSTDDRSNSNTNSEHVDDSSLKEIIPKMISRVQPEQNRLTEQIHDANIASLQDLEEVEEMISQQSSLNNDENRKSAMDNSSNKPIVQQDEVLFRSERSDLLEVADRSNRRMEMLGDLHSDKTSEQGKRESHRRSSKRVEQERRDSYERSDKRKEQEKRTEDRKSDRIKEDRKGGSYAKSDTSEQEKRASVKKSERAFEQEKREHYTKLDYKLKQEKLDSYEISDKRVKTEKRENSEKPGIRLEHQTLLMQSNRTDNNEYKSREDDFSEKYTSSSKHEKITPQSSFEKHQKRHRPLEKSDDSKLSTAPDARKSGSRQMSAETELKKLQTAQKEFVVAKQAFDAAKSSQNKKLTSQKGDKSLSHFQEMMIKEKLPLNHNDPVIIMVNGQDILMSGNTALCMTENEQGKFIMNLGTEEYKISISGDKEKVPYLKNELQNQNQNQNMCPTKNDPLFFDQYLNHVQVIV